MEKLIKIFIALLKCGICGTEITSDIKEMITPDLQKKIYGASKIHDIVHLTGTALEKLGLLPEERELYEKYSYGMQKALYTYLQQENELQSIVPLFEEQKIYFIPLKGAVIKKLYPRPDMRNSCDIDILVKQEQLDLAVKCLEEKLGYVCKTRASHEVVMITPGGDHIELHFDLIEKGRVNVSDKVLENVWNDATPVDGYVFYCRMSNEMFYFYHIAHMMKHFVGGGCGVKSFADLWIMKQKMAFDDDKRKALLCEGRLLKFAKAAEQLAECWFGEGVYTDVLREMEVFVITGGSYGNIKNQVAVRQAKSNGNTGIASKIFLPYDVIKYQYPTLQKHKWLLPFYEVKRWCRLVFCPGERERSIKHLAVNNMLSKETKNSTKELIEYLEIL